VKIRFIERAGELVLQPLTREYIRKVRGMFKSEASATQELLRERARDRERENKH
jgi:hypothetical protein